MQGAYIAGLIGCFVATNGLTSVRDGDIGWVQARLNSDHTPLTGESIIIPKPLNSTFRFNRAWTQPHNFLNTVETYWQKQLYGAPMFKFQQKLKRMKYENLKLGCKNVKDWLKKCMPMMRWLYSAQQQSALENALNLKDSFWKQKCGTN
ncbi:hypothetical protein AQUCO_02000245v1 [Aquilegia coerulea]|uniref:Uncharacterized protein n=1 Tax=Aquilegia coerulea TaxID=218851 RepID=A0A2G5DGL1_AQUCA|nr:hypothetical protein AQUCO_02000245v1 [Aquilegia coerulea]